MKSSLKVKNFPDVQGRKDSRGVELERAGIKGFRMPVVVYDKTKGTQFIEVVY